MRYAIALVVLCGALVLGWAVAYGTAADVGMATIAVFAVVFFSTLPVLLGVASRRAANRRVGGLGVSAESSPIVVRERPASPAPAHTASPSHPDPNPAPHLKSTGNPSA